MKRYLLVLALILATALVLFSCTPAQPAAESPAEQPPAAESPAAESPAAPDTQTPVEEPSPGP